MDYQTGSLDAYFHIPMSKTFSLRLMDSQEKCYERHAITTTMSFSLYEEGSFIRRIGGENPFRKCGLLFNSNNPKTYWIGAVLLRLLFFNALLFSKQLVLATHNTIVAYLKNQGCTICYALFLYRCKEILLPVFSIIFIK